jgi:hypothetical protein
LGLLLLRSAVGTVAIVRGVIDLGWSDHGAVGPLVIGVAAVVSGASLLAGFLTPLTGGLIALGAATIASPWVSLPSANQTDMRLMMVFVAVVAATVILLGPGAFSVDARLFGRREIIIPRSPRSPKP